MAMWRPPERIRHDARPGRSPDAATAAASGQGDIVSIARQALADPDWFRKVRPGRGAEVRLCKYTNYCEALERWPTSPRGARLESLIRPDTGPLREE